LVVPFVIWPITVLVTLTDDAVLPMRDSLHRAQFRASVRPLPPPPSSPPSASPPPPRSEVPRNGSTHHQGSLDHHFIDVLLPRRPNHPQTYDQPHTWHAQAGQDKTIAHLFSLMRGGFFVDLAANHAVVNSNTRALERDFGWRGLCIDGNVELLWELANERTCQVLGTVVTSRTGATATFALDANDAVSGIIAKGVDNHTLTTRAVRHYTTVSLLDVLAYARAPASIDYLSLDVEGAEDDVLLPFPLATSGYTFRAVTIERPTRRLRQHLVRGGYHFLRDHGCFGDQLWVHNSFVGTATRILGLVPWDIELARTLPCTSRVRGVRAGEKPPAPGNRLVKRKSAPP